MTSVGIESATLLDPELGKVKQESLGEALILLSAADIGRFLLTVHCQTGFASL